MVTSTNGRWLFPKGYVGAGETLNQAALKEAGEEAGLRGRIRGKPLGRFQYQKLGKTMCVTVLLMQVTQCDEQWEEAHKRQRRWVSPEEAMSLVTLKELGRLVHVARQRIAK
jgi:8-oxo-dGTP pyrophosphatase MutT (NUDIX family)